MEWIINNIWELKKSVSLRYLGFFLSLNHVITFFQWNQLYSQPEVGTQVVCWNFFPRCAEAAFVTGGGGALYTYLGLAVLSALLFLMGAAVASGAWTLLATTFALKLCIYLFDYRLYENIQVLLIFIELGFLLVPNKTGFTKAIFVGYFLTSGLGKISTEWLTGFVFEPLNLPTKTNEWLAALSVFCEFFFPFFILSSKLKRLSIGFAFLLAYQFFWGFAESFYPLAYTFFILCFFPIALWESGNIERNYVYRSFIRPEPSKAWAPIAFIIFIVVQALPIWIQSEWPITPVEVARASLPLECEQKSFAVYEDKVRLLNHNFENEPPSIRCHSKIRLSQLQQLCRSLKKEENFQTIFSQFASRSFSESQFSKIFEISDICKK